eukprot:SAG31_NODE_17959_length_651_cov_4.356884_1_plen_21_part_10
MGNDLVAAATAAGCLPRPELL